MDVFTIFFAGLITVTFRAPAGDEVAFRTDSGKVLRVKGRATVRIVNDPPLGATGEHSHMYLKLLADATRMDEPVRIGSCGPRRRVITHIEGVGCPNNNYP